MRYLRQQFLNRRRISDYRLYVDTTDSVVMNTPNNLQMPKGLTSERPVSPKLGMIRYNKTTNEVEVYQGVAEGSGSWRSLRYKEAGKVILQSLGNIDGYTYYYGPLNAAYDPTNVATTTDNFGGQNILVFIENVFQIFNTNYVVTQNPVASASLTTQANSGTTTLVVASTASIPNNSIVTGDPALQSNTVATVVNATTISINNILNGNILNGTSLTFTSPAGYYLNFTSDPAYSSMIGKPITILHGFDK